MTEVTQDPDNGSLISRRKKLLGPAYQLFYDNPVHLVKGEGVWLFDADGDRYLDMYNNVPHVGHCHPHVVEALQKQIETGSILVLPIPLSVGCLRCNLRAPSAARRNQRCTR